jgi:hypothetical protein
MFSFLKVYFITSFLMTLVVITLLTAAVIVVETVERPDVVEDEELGHLEKEQQLSKLSRITGLVSGLVILTLLQILIGWKGVSKLSVMYLTLYGALDVLSAMLLFTLSFYLTYYRVTILFTTLITLIHVSVPYGIIQEVRRADRLSI